MADCVISAHNLKKIYKMGEMAVNALDGVDLCVDRGEVIAIMGPSGYRKVNAYEYTGMPGPSN